MMVGGYALFATVTTVSASPFIAVPLALAVGAAVGVLVYALLMRPMAGHPVFAAVLVTVSLGILLRVAVVLVYTDQTRYPLPAMDLSNPPVRLPGGAAVSALDVVTVASAAALLGGLFAFLRLSRLGIRMRAAAERPLLAAQRGIDFHALFALSWALASLIVGLAVLPRVASPFVLELVTQSALAAVGALALNMLTGLAGQISLGHAGFLCAGAFTVGILTESVKAPPLVTLPAAAVVGGLLGLVVGVPSLRLKGLYLALGTLAMHFVVLYVASEYQARWGFNTGVSVPAPVIAGIRVRTGVQWYYVLVAFAMLTTFLSVNLGRSRVGRAWMAIHDREIAAASLGIAVARYKLLAFVASSVLTALAGALWAYYRSFVSVEAFSFVVTIEFIAMIVIGGMGSTLGALLGAGFVTLLPYGIDAVVGALAPGGAAPYWLFPLKFGAFGLLMALFLVFEPLGLVGIWRRARTWVVLWPLRYAPLRTVR